MNLYKQTTEPLGLKLQKNISTEAVNCSAVELWSVDSGADIGAEQPNGFLTKPLILDQGELGTGCWAGRGNIEAGLEE